MLNLIIVSMAIVIEKRLMRVKPNRMFGAITVKIVLMLPIEEARISGWTLFISQSVSFAEQMVAVQDRSRINPRIAQTLKNCMLINKLIAMREKAETRVSKEMFLLSHTSKSPPEKTPAARKVPTNVIVKG